MVVHGDYLPQATHGRYLLHCQLSKDEGEENWVEL